MTWNETRRWSENGRLTRRRFLTLGGAFLAGTAMRPGKVLARVAAGETVRVGVVTPIPTPRKPLQASLFDLVGVAARQGALLAEEDVGNEAAALGMRLDILRANSPSADAAYRAAERLVTAEGVCAIVGGVGDGQAEALNEVARERRVPFFNVGSTSDALRGAAYSRYTFHVEASAAMYVDALAAWHASAGRRRWFIVHEDSGEGVALQRRAVKAVARHGSGGGVVGTAAVRPGQPVFDAEFGRIRRSDADVVLLLLGPRDQLAYFVRAGYGDVDAAIAPFPHPVTQTRDYVGAVHFQSPRADAMYRVGLWETTGTLHGGETLNRNYVSRWGSPMNPSAWAAYQAIHMLVETVAATRSSESAAIVEYLESPHASFDVNKGMKASFRPWDHQLRQPLCVIKTNPDAEWGDDVAKRLAVADWVTEIPTTNLASESAAAELLDRFGDGPGR